MKQKILSFSVISLSFLLFISCSDSSKFRGATAKDRRDQEPPSEERPGSPPSDPEKNQDPSKDNPKGSDNPKDEDYTTKEPFDPNEPCKKNQTLIGGDVIFLVDNSFSNRETDCKKPKKTNDNVFPYRCEGGATNREKAVLTTYDYLDKMSKWEQADSITESTISVAAFPTPRDANDGWHIMSPGWFELVGKNRDMLARKMTFTRLPVYGWTSFGAAMSAAQELESGLDTNKKERVAVLITDGESTDTNPDLVKYRAQNLKKHGVRIITVHVTGPKLREERQREHAEYLRNRGYGERTISKLVGINGKNSLVKEISNDVFEVTQSAELEKLFKEEVIKRMVRCE